MKHRHGIRRAVAYEGFLGGTLVAAAVDNQQWPLPVYVALGVLLLVASVFVADAIGGAALILPIVPFGVLAAFVLATATGPAQYVGIGLINVGLVWLGTEILILVGVARRLWKWTGATD